MSSQRFNEKPTKTREKQRGANKMVKHHVHINEARNQPKCKNCFCPSVQRSESILVTDRLGNHAHVVLVYDVLAGDRVLLER
jgi:UDP-2,3-diacylglucosamine pyrophosphatase LpxH